MRGIRKASGHLLAYGRAIHVVFRGLAVHVNPPKAGIFLGPSFHVLGLPYSASLQVAVNLHDPNAHLVYLV